DISARLPYRDDDDARCGLPGRVELPAGRTAAPANDGAPQAGPGHAEGPQPPAGSLRSAVDDHYASRLKACPGRASFDSLNGSRGKTSFPELINTARMTRTELAGLRLISLTDPAINGHTDSAASIRSDAGPEVGSRTVTGADPQLVSNLRRWAQDGESVPASGSGRGSNGGCIPCTVVMRRGRRQPWHRHRP